MDFCQFQPYVQYKGYLDRLDPQQTIVVNWMPACRMPLPYDNARAIPIGILMTYLVLLLIKTVLKYAQIFRTQGPQQTNMAILQNTPATPDLSERDSGEDRFL